MNPARFDRSVFLNVSQVAFADVEHAMQSMRVEPEIWLMKLRAAAVCEAVRISPRCASSAVAWGPGLFRPQSGHRGGDVAQQPDCDWL